MAKVNKKDLFDNLGDFSGGDFGGDTGGIDWSSIIGQQPENGSFVGPGGTDPNGLTGGDYNQLWDQAGEGLNPDGSFKFPSLGGGSGGGTNGGLTNQDGSINWGTLLAMLAAGGGGLMNHNATQQATQQTLQGLHDTGTQVANTLGGAHAGFAPYMQAGQNALQQLSNMPPSNIAANFSPIGSGRGISLSRIARGS